MKMKTERLFKIVFISWVAVWFFFLCRGLIKGEARDYANLLGRDLEEKRAYVSGEEFYRFITFCRNVIPEDSDYKIEANYDASMDYYRFAYYIYPAMRDLEDPEYIACYKTRFDKRGYGIVSSVDETKYVLKKTGK